MFRPPIALALALAALLISRAATAAASDDEMPVRAEAKTLEVPQQSAAPTRIIDEIIVTATKRQQSVRDIPASLIAIKGEDLEEMGAQGLADFINLTPGVAMRDDAIIKRVTIRGISSAAITSHTTGAFVGEVPFNNPYVPRVTVDPNPFDLATVEILKGPQGTLFGGSALNGAIRYVPNAPRFDGWEAKLFSQYETVNQGDAGRIYGAALNLPLREDLALRFVAHDRHSAGWIDIGQRGELDTNDTRQDSARLMALWKPGERWTIDAITMGQRTHTPELAISTDNGEMDRQVGPRPSPLTMLYAFSSLGVKYAFDGFDLLLQNTQMNKSMDIFLDATYLVEGSSDNPPSALVAPIINNNDGQVHEIRLTSNPDAYPKWHWLGGLFGYKVSVFESFQYIAAPDTVIPQAGPLFGLIPNGNDVVADNGVPEVAHLITDVDFLELAAFGEATRLIGDKLELTLGLRYYQMILDGTNTGTGALVASNAVSQGSTHYISGGRSVERGINPKLAARYLLSDQISLYASASRGFRFGGVQLVADPGNGEIPETYQSDNLWNYEIGARTQWLDNTLIADATVFYVDWQDAQLSVTHSSGVAAYVLNVGGVRSYGLETSLEYLPPVDGLALSLSGSLQDTRTTEDFTDPAGNYTPKGSRWPNSANAQSAATLSYQRALGTWSMATAVTHTYIGPGFGEIAQTTRVFDYETWAFQLNFTQLSWPGRPQVGLNLSNLSDERGIASSTAPLTASSPGLRTYIRPRAVTLRLSMDF